LRFSGWLEQTYCADGKRAPASSRTQTRPTRQLVCGRGSPSGGDR
jgi:hypothetical protein